MHRKLMGSFVEIQNHPLKGPRDAENLEKPTLIIEDVEKETDENQNNIQRIEAIDLNLELENSMQTDITKSISFTPRSISPRNRDSLPVALSSSNTEVGSRPRRGSDKGLNINLSKVKAKEKKMSFSFLSRRSADSQGKKSAEPSPSVSPQPTDVPKAVIASEPKSPDEYEFQLDTFSRVHEQVRYGDDSFYEGEVTDSTKQRHGNGTLTYSNGDMFVGTFAFDAKYGRGDCYFSKSELISSFVGFWKWDKVNQSKPGKITYRSGEQYVGKVKGSPGQSSSQQLSELPHILKHGRFVSIVSITHSLSLRGEFVGLNYKYYGSFLEDKKDGYGVMVFNKKESIERQYYGSFQNDLKSGYGVMMYADGGYFVGMFQNDIKCGQGTFYLSNGDSIEGVWDGNDMKNATFKKGSVQDTARCSRLLIYQQVKRLEDNNNQYKIQFSHGDSPTLPEKDLISRDKWKGFFLRFSTQVEEEKKRFKESTTYHFIQDRKKSITDSNGKLSPMSRKSIQDALLTYLYCQINHKNGSATETFKSDQDGCESSDHISSDEKNVLSSITVEFVNLFHWRFYGQSVNSGDQLPYALDDYYSFVHELYHTVVQLLGIDAAAIYGQKQLMYFLKNMVLKRIYHTLFNMYKQRYQEQDNMYRFKLLSLAQVTIQELGVKEQYIPKNKIFSESFSEAIFTLQNLCKCTTSHEKYQQLVCANQQMLDVLQGCSVGADELLPIYFYVFIKSNLPNLYSEYQFMLDFIDDAVKSSEWGYRFSNFENALQYVHMLDCNIRDESGVLVPILVLEDRMCGALEQCMKESKRDKAAQAPRLLWLSNVFVMVGNQINNCQNRQFSITNRQHINMMNTYFDYARRIVSSVGLKITRKNVNKDTSNLDSEQWTDVVPKRWRSPSSEEYQEFGYFSDNIEYTLSFDHLYPSYVYFRMASKIEEVINQKEKL
ncbi:MORN repeat-containing protein [Acrasis kona]|uniref:MORN repeat-containing protein n=1 Tax=Acrasis kona TaxID=1008807 RepID=A0AAW2YPN4_9EUKA